MKLLEIDEKWAVEYDPNSNDRPVGILRNGEKHKGHLASNLELAMFYRILELEELCRSEGVNL